jgi:hypothetical protein
MPLLGVGLPVTDELLDRAYAASQRKDGLEVELSMIDDPNCLIHFAERLAK